MKNSSIQSANQNPQSQHKKNHTFILKSQLVDESLLDKNVSTKSMSRHRQFEQLMKDFSNKNSEDKNQNPKKSGEAQVYSANLIQIQSNKFANLSQQKIQQHGSQQQSLAGLSISNSSSNQGYQSQADKNSNVNSQSFQIGSNLQHQHSLKLENQQKVHLPLILDKNKYAPFQKSTLIQPLESNTSINFSTIGKSNVTSKMMFDHLNSNKSSNLNLQKHSHLNQSAFITGREGQKLNGYLAQSIDLRDNEKSQQNGIEVEGNHQFQLDLGKIKTKTKTSRQLNSKRLAQRSQSQMNSSSYLTASSKYTQNLKNSTISKNEIKHDKKVKTETSAGPGGDLSHLEYYDPKVRQITEETQENIDSRKQFYETFRPNQKDEKNHDKSPGKNISPSKERMFKQYTSLINRQPKIQTQEYTLANNLEAISQDQQTSNDGKQSEQFRSNMSFMKMSILSTQKDTITSSQKKEKKPRLISSDYVPGPGQYNLGGTFKSINTEKTIPVSHRRQMSQGYENPLETNKSVVLNKSTSRGLSYGQRSIDHARSIYSTSAMAKNGQATVDGSFGLSFDQLRKQYFKHYDVEIYGRHSPGPGAYSPKKDSDFKDDQYDEKTMPKEKRVCPIVPKQQQELKTSPFHFNQQISSFNLHKNGVSYFGSKAERIIDSRLFGHKHMFIVQKGLY